MPDQTNRKLNFVLLLLLLHRHMTLFGQWVIRGSIRESLSSHKLYKVSAVLM